MKKLWPFLVFLLITGVIFRQSLFKGLIPLPADLTVGAYYPWLDQTWSGYPTGVPVKNPALSDAISLQYPWKLLSMLELKQGIIPWWNPYSGFGTPLAANFQSQALYPLNLIFFLPLPFHSNWTIFIALQTFLGLTFSFLFAKSLKLSSLASLFVALIFSLSAFLTVWLEYGNYGHTLLWLPAILWTITRFRQTNRPIWLLTTSLFTALLWYAGYPFLAAWCLALIGLYWLIFSRAPQIVVALLLGTILALPQLLPGWQLYRLSVRETDVKFTLEQTLIPARHLLTFLAPDLFGNPATYNYVGHLVYPEVAWYLGLLPLTLIIFAIFSLRSRQVLFFALVALFVLLTITPTPLARAFYSLPLPGLKGAALARSFSILTLSLALLAGFGLDQMRRKPIKILPPFFVVLAFITALLVVSFINPQLFNSLLHLNNLDKLLVSRRNLYLPLSLALGGTLTIIILSYLKLSKLIVPLFLILTLADLTRFSDKYLPFVKPDLIFPDTKITQFLHSQPGIFRSTGVLPRNMYLPYQLSFVQTLDPLLPADFTRYLNALNNRSALVGTRYAEILNYQSPLVDFANVKYVLATEELSLPKLRLVYQEGQTRVYENTRVLPRAQIISHYQVEPDPQKTTALMYQSDLSQTVILEKEPFFVSQNTLPNLLPLVEIQKYSPQEIIISAVSPTSSLLVLSDLFYPGWQATVNNLPTSIIQANLSFRAVPIPAGNSTVKLTYTPSFALSLTQ